jgi:hypothetical protein
MAELRSLLEDLGWKNVGDVRPERQHRLQGALTASVKREAVRVVTEEVVTA